MTELKKKSRWYFPWIIAAIAAAVLVTYLWYLSNRDIPASRVTEEAGPVASQEMDGRVAAFIRFTEDTGRLMGLDHAYTHEGLSKLSAAVNAMGERSNLQLDDDLDSVQMYAQMVTTAPYATSHADHISRAAALLATAMEQIQQAGYPNLAGELVQVKNAASRIDPDQLTLDQREAVKAYFRTAANLLRRMQ